jgi:cell division septal protein FtsQ
MLLQPVASWTFEENNESNDEGGITMTNRNNNRNQPHTGGSKAADTEFGAELNQSKKARKQATRDSKNK